MNENNYQNQNLHQEVVDYSVPQNFDYQPRIRERDNSTVEFKRQTKRKPSNPFRTLFTILLSFLLIGGILLAGIFASFYYFANRGQRTGNQPLSQNNPIANLVQPQQTQPRGPVQFTNQVNARSTTEVVNTALPSVLSLNIRADNRVAAGTGFIASDDGLVITNKHVVALACQVGAQSLQISALSNDQKAYKLRIMSIDPVDDIAILKIENPPAGLRKVEFGDSAKLQLGEDVVAIGNALGTLQNTVTRGIISGLDRSFDTQSLRDECTNTEFRVDGLIQTDAAINKGNSGGPLFNAFGQMIAMNTLGTDAQSVGLAIPSATILTVLNGYIQNKSIVRPRLGVISQEINPLTKAQYPWLPVDYGEFVGSIDLDVPNERVVSQGSSAAEAGIGANDIILEINGQRLISAKDNPTPLRRSILNKQSGETVQITFIKANSANNGSVTYDSNPITKQVKLKGITYNLSSNKSVLVN
jgi:S1-C subfamily serine protease